MLVLNPFFISGFSKLGAGLQVVRRLSVGKGLDLTGIYPPIPTPFNTDESIAWDKLKENMKKWNEFPLRGFLVQGSNGEFCYLTEEERIEMIKVVKSLSPDKLVLAGSGCESTAATIRVTNKMAEVGADAAVVVTPCYYKGKMTMSALEDHFTRVADASSLPVILYSVPANTSIDIPVELVRRLARHPNIIGIKDSGGDVSKMGSMVHVTKGENFQILAGSASYLLSALAVGASGGVCGLANVLPKEVCELQTLFDEAKMEEAKSLQHRLIAPNAAVTSVHGPPGLKTSLEWFGFYGGPCRRPLQPLTELETKNLENAFKENKFL